MAGKGELGVKRNISAATPRQFHGGETRTGNSGTNDKTGKRMKKYLKSKGMIK